MNSTGVSVPPTGSKGLRISLWVIQGLLAALFVMAGGMKFVATPGQLTALPLPEALIRLIGAAELAGGIGILLPAALRILPILTPLAAVALTVLMVGAAGFNVAHGMASTAGFPLAIGVLTSFVAWGRFVKLPILPGSSR